MPGMAWVAPRDAETFGDWSETDEPTLPTPSQGATPQLTTKSGTSALGSTAEPAAPNTKKIRRPASRRCRNPTRSIPIRAIPYCTSPNHRLPAVARGMRPGPTTHRPARARARTTRPRTATKTDQSRSVVFTAVNMASRRLGHRKSHRQPVVTPSRVPAAVAMGNQPRIAATVAMAGGEDLPILPPRREAETEPLVSDAESGYEPYGGQSYDRSTGRRTRTAVFCGVGGGRPRRFELDGYDTTNHRRPARPTISERVRNCAVASSKARLPLEHDAGINRQCAGADPTSR